MCKLCIVLKSKGYYFPASDRFYLSWYNTNDKDSNSSNNDNGNAKSNPSANNGDKDNNNKSNKKIIIWTWRIRPVRNIQNVPHLTEMFVLNVAGITWKIALVMPEIKMLKVKSAFATKVSSSICVGHVLCLGLTCECCPAVYGDS